jgi:O-antigen/teichoic acid export membrane protein
VAQSTPVSTSFSIAAVRGTLWSYLSYFSGKLLNFISTLILARLLVPEQFGLVAYCTLVIQYLDIINTAGLGHALVARKDKFEQAANSAFVASIVLGLASFIVSWFSAPLVANFFREEGVTDLFRVLCLSLPIGNLGLVPTAILGRNLEFRKRVINDFGRILTKGVVSVALAFAGWGPWSLVYGQLAGELIGSILAWALAGWRPSRTFDRQVSREVLIFGFHIILANVAAELRNNVDYIIVGRILGPALLGIYTMAYRIPELVIGNINMVVASVTFPLLSRAQNDSATLRSVYFGYIRYIALFAYLAAFGLVLVSGPFVEAFLSPAWNDMILPMSLIAVAFGIKAIGYVTGVLYKAVGRPDILNRILLTQFPLAIVVLIYCSRWGIIGVAAGQAVLSFVYVGMATIVANRLLKFRLRELLEALWPAVVSSLVMIAVVKVFQLNFDLGGLVGVLAYAALGGAIYFGVLRLINREIIRDAFSTLRAALSRS